MSFSIRNSTYSKYYSSILLVILLCASLCSGGPGYKSRYRTYDNPYITLYANEYYKGTQHVEFLRGGCKNLPEQHDNWASSINTHKRCVDVCDLRDCEGDCVRIYPTQTSKTNPSLKLELLGMNDRISSIKSCYTVNKRG